MSQKNFRNLEPGDSLFDMHDHGSLHKEKLPWSDCIVEPVQLADVVYIRTSGGDDFMQKIVQQYQPRWYPTNKVLYVVDVNERGERIVAYSYDDRFFAVARLTLKETETKS